MSAHTPGPWCCEPDDLDPSGFVVTSTQRPYVATVHGGKHATAKPNANLIAAAPELLEIVQTFDAYMGHAGEDAERNSNNPIRALRWKAQQVIAKATGATA